MAELGIHGHRCVICGHLCVPHCECPEGLRAVKCENQAPGMRSEACMNRMIEDERIRRAAEGARTAEE